MRNATLMKEVLHFSTAVLGKELANKFTKGIVLGSGHVSINNPDFENRISHIDFDMEDFGFGMRKGHFGFGTWSKELPSELVTEVLLAAAIAAEEVLGVQEGVMNDSGVRIDYEPQVRVDSLRYINIYFPYSMKDYGPQEQDLRAVAMLNFAKPIMEAIIQSTEREIRKWNLRQRKQA